jgi:hypothetical protein
LCFGSPNYIIKPVREALILQHPAGAEYKGWMGAGSAPVRQMLSLPTTREMKYKAKQAVDTFFVRMGDVASGGWVALAISALGLGLRGFALGNALLVGVWLWLAVAIVRAQRALAETALSSGKPET